MVQGTPAIKLGPENDAKLLQAVVLIHATQPDYKKIASVFGPNVSVRAIQYRINIIRKEGASLGLTAGSPVPAQTATKTRKPVSRKKQTKGRMRRALMKDDLSDNESIRTMTTVTSDREPTPPQTSDGKGVPTSNTNNKVLHGRVIKARLSTRKPTKVDYMKLGDPFIGIAAKDGNGENLFGDQYEYSSEDTYATDGDFKHDKPRAVVKAKEAGSAV